MSDSNSGTPVAEPGIRPLDGGRDGSSPPPSNPDTPVAAINAPRVGEVEVAVAVDEDYENETIFAMDEDHPAVPPRHHVHPDTDASSTDVEETDEGLSTDDELAASGLSDRFPESGFRRSGRFAAARPNTSTRLPSSSIAASLPVAISRGFWPPREERLDGDSTLDEDKADEGAEEEKTILPQRHTDIYERIQAYSRSIQPADDPERLFGERPRRRYRTGRDSTGEYEGPPSLAHTTITSESTGSTETPNARAVVGSITALPAADEIGIVRSVMGGGGLPLGMSIPLVARDLNITTPRTLIGQVQPPASAVAGDEMVVVGRLAGEVGSRPRIIIPASLPLHQI